MFFKKKKGSYYINTASLFELLKSNNKVRSSADLKCSLENLDKELQMIKSNVEEMKKESENLFNKTVCNSITKTVLSHAVEKKADYISDLKITLFFIVYCHDFVEFWNYMNGTFSDNEALYNIIYSTLCYLGFDAELSYSFSIGRFIKC